VVAVLSLWAAIAVGGVLSDALTGAFAGVWVAAAAVGAGALGALGLPAGAQALGFAALAAALLGAIRPLLVQRPRGVCDHPELLVGKLGAVLDPVDAQLASGRVAIEGVQYVARTAAGCPPLPQGAGIRVRAVESGEVVVERI
jgi:membrane protein implicated in regulation of membrane protease activity